MSDVQSIPQEVLEEVPTQLSAEDMGDIERRVQALASILDAEKERTATYKIEAVFDKRKTNRGIFPGSIILFRASQANGAGDEVMYPCPSQMLGGPPCSGVIPPENISSTLGLAVCPECQKKWKKAQLLEVTFFNLPPEKWAYVLSREFFRLKCDSDIIIKVAEEDLRKKSEVEIEQRRHGEALYAARSTRRTIEYRLADLIRDVNAGAVVEKRLRALITA